MFPITDPAREHDIRLRRRRGTLLLAGIGVCVALVINGQSGMPTASRPGRSSDPDDVRWRAIGEEARDRVRADLDRIQSTRDQRRTRRGGSVDAPAAEEGAARSFDAPGPVTVDLPCAEKVRLAPTDGSSGAMRVAAGPDAGAALSGLSFSGNVLSADCTSTRGSELTVQLPADRQITVRQSGTVDVTGGRFSGPVRIEVNGSGDVHFEATGNLAVAVNGSGDVSVKQLDGTLHAELHASGDLRIDFGHVPQVEAVLDGSGDLSLGHAVVDRAVVRVDSSSDVAFGRIDGGLDAKNYGGGDFMVEELDADAASLDQHGSGSITIRSGRIGTLHARRAGSGDLSVMASVGTGSLDEAGGGDTSIPNVTGELRRSR